jgi:superoxide dismutase, Fe-Mn family
MPQTDVKAAFALPKLPYDAGSLEPVISARTISFHYGKHHAGYVNTLNKLVDGTAFAGMSLEQIVVQTSGKPPVRPIFNCAAQAWNHEFYWQGMRAGGGGEPTGRLKSAIERDFGTFRDFCESFTKAATGKFGSGWVWLIEEMDGKLKIVATDDADTPLAHRQKPLLTLDVWEHAYYLDFQNRRPDYIAGWLEKLVDWRSAERILG